MGFFDFLSKGNRDKAKRKSRQMEEGIFSFVVVKEVQELLAKGQSFKKLGREHEAQQKFNEAMHVARRGIEKYPDAFDLRRLLCGIYLELGELNTAERCLKKLIAEHSERNDADLTEPYTRLGVIKWYHLKDVPAAIKYLNLALRSVTKTTEGDIASEPHIYLAQIYWEDNNPKEARNHALKRLQAVKDCPMASMIYEQVENAKSKTNGDQEARIKWHIVAEYIKPPVVLHGQSRSISLTTVDHYTKIVSLLIAAKNSGWRGGNDFFVIAKGDGVVRRFESGMAIIGSEAKELAEVIKNYYQGWQKDSQIHDFVMLCEGGGFRIQT